MLVATLHTYFTIKRTSQFVQSTKEMEKDFYLFNINRGMELNIREHMYITAKYIALSTKQKKN